jgi:hypothetical protein
VALCAGVRLLAGDLLLLAAGDLCLLAGDLLLLAGLRLLAFPADWFIILYSNIKIKMQIKKK